MFMCFETSSGKICINISKVFFFCEGKGHTTSLVLDDGTVIESKFSFDEFYKNFFDCLNEVPERLLKTEK